MHLKPTWLVEVIDRLGMARPVDSGGNSWGARKYELNGAQRPPGKSIAGRIGGISAYDRVVIAWGNHCCADGGGANAYTHAAAYIGSAINAAAMEASCTNTAGAESAPIRQSFSRNTRDAKDDRCSNGQYGSRGHGVSFLRLPRKLKAHGEGVCIKLDSSAVLQDLCCYPA
jgi:hypothetical protein